MTKDDDAGPRPASAPSHRGEAAAHMRQRLLRHLPKRLPWTALGSLLGGTLLALGMLRLAVAPQGAGTAPAAIAATTTTAASTSGRGAIGTGTAGTSAVGPATTRPSTSAGSATAPAAAPPALQQPSAGAPPAEIIYAQRLVDADGKPQEFSQWKGQRLLLNFWATWCVPCVAEMPELDQARVRYADRGLVIVGVGTEDLAQVHAFRDRLSVRIPLLAGGNEALELARALGDTQGVLPYSVLLSADGAVLRSHAGALRPGQIDQWLGAAP